MNVFSWLSFGFLNRPKFSIRSRGNNGFCKYAEACRYSHAGPKGGSANKTTLATTVKRVKKNKVKLTSLAVSSSKNKRAKGTSNEGNR